MNKHQYHSIIIDFEPISRRLSLKSVDDTLYEMLMKLDIKIRAECGGVGSCGKCRILIQEGTHFFNKPTPAEKLLLEKNQLNQGWRLACQAKIDKNQREKILQKSSPQLKIFLPEATLVEDFKILTSGAGKDIPLNPLVKKIFLEVESPTLEKPLADFERVMEGISLTNQQLRIPLEIEYDLLKQLPDLLRKNESKITLTIWDDHQIIDIEPNIHEEENFGIAFDIGTTTIVGYLINLNNKKIYAVHSKLNPQTAFGEDLITRITYIKNHPEGLEKLRTLVIEALNGIVQNVCQNANVHPSHIYEAVVVGNSAMHHIFLGMTPVNIGLSPYTPIIQKGLNLKAKDVGLNIARHANLYILPLVAGFVGADTMGVILSSEIYNESKLSLAIDIGTNGEIILGNKDHLVTGSCAAGSALEGAHMKYGMRAAAGSIDSVKIDPNTLHTTLTTIKHKKPIGICGSGLIDAVAEMLRANILFRNGNFNKELLNHNRFLIHDNEKEFIVAFREETSLDEPITISLSDIRQVQMAKAAFYSGTRILLDNLQTTYHKQFKIEQVFLAGAFGNYIDKENARFIGMIPDISSDKIFQIGNAAGVGAQFCLLNNTYRQKASELLKDIHYVEIAVKQKFQREYAEAMYFPHMNLNLFPNLTRYQTIPTR
ncbi:MAG: Na(+)-translocating NADH-quinone reductase subunit F [Promethearchaeota archaeon]|nr:MAG: Na(+)-translocating NADH-quinone reductase subunit F [Candidatus Lokiarchaeota archaeon]